jgi:hypothetical protein
MDTNVQKRRKPRKIMYNLPDEITMENAVDKYMNKPQN